MSRVLVLSPYTAKDRVLLRSRWVAERNVARLSEEGHDVETVSGAACAGQIPVPPGTDGVAFFGHGQEDEVQGSDGHPLFEGDAVQDLHDRWVHAFACDAATLLGPRLLASGVTTFAGYTLHLSAWWDEALVPPELAPAFADVVTCLTSALAAGVSAETDLSQRLGEAVDRVTRWAEAHPGRDRGIRLFCQQLFDGLRVLSRRPSQP